MRARLGVLIAILAVCCLAVLFDVPSYVIETLDERHLAEQDRQVRQRALFLQSVRKRVIERRGEMPDAEVLQQELGAVVKQVGNPHGRQYAAVQLDGKTYVVELPQAPSETVCLLEPDGTVIWRPADMEPLAELLHEYHKKNQPRGGRDAPVGR